jgi:hypothetical protein
MKRIIYLSVASVLVLLSVADASAQSYRRDNRKGNRAFASGDFDKAMKHYEGSLAKDTVNTLPLLYNAAYTLHSDRRDSLQNMAKDSIAVNYLDRLAEAVVGTEYEHDYHFTKGVLAIDMKDWQKAMDEFKTCMIMDPNDMEARENYIYAKEHLSKDNGGGGGQDQQNQDQQNQDQQDQNQQDQQNQDQNKDQQGQQQNPDGQNESRISPQAAKQILQAMQAKERETQDKVEKKKAEALKSKQKEKNW